MRAHVVLGGPGCGKTTRLIEILEKELERVEPEEVAFVSFTRRAADEARERVMSDLSIPEERLPWFRTIHSTAYRHLDMTPEEVLSSADVESVCDMLGLPGPVGKNDSEEGPVIRNVPSALVDFARASDLSVREAWEIQEPDISVHEAILYMRTLLAYKKNSGKRDFADMLDGLAEATAVPVRVAIIDEAQDLSAQQWRAAENAFHAAERIYVAGDDDQAIHRWAGADVNRFLAVEGEREVLPISHRLPVEVFNVAKSVASLIERRHDKPYRSTGRKGVVEWESHWEYVDLSEGSWLLLARNAYMLPWLVKYAREEGINYSTKDGPAVKDEHKRAIKAWEGLRRGQRLDADSVNAAAKYMSGVEEVPESTSWTLEDLGWGDRGIWHDALDGISIVDREFYLAVRRRGEPLLAPPRVRISTIHGAKGAEADCVMLLTDVSYRTHEGMRLSPDDEHRVFFVGLTRARERLHVVGPQTNIFYDEIIPF